MDEQLKISYETRGSSSYMTVTCPADVELIHYQLEMMLSNDIKKLLPVSRQVIDGETVIYYNITSRISLDQILEKRKLTRKELLRLIQGAILAIRDASDFRLPSEGILMETGRIYVNPASCDPAFVFLPIQSTGGYGIKELVTGLIMNDKIEMSNDNLIQVLLKELNSQPFSVDKLEKCLEPYYGMKGNIQNQAMTAPQTVNSQTPVSPFVSSQSISPQPGVQQQESRPPVTPPPVAGQQESRQPVAAPSMDLPPVKPPVKGSGTPKRKDNKKKKNTAVQETKGDGFDVEKAKKKFLLPQALIIVAVAAGISFGVFTDENGAIAINTVLAVVIGIAAAEVILYREIYINGKNGKEEKKTSKEKRKKDVKTGPVASKGKPALPKPSQPAVTSKQSYPQASAQQQMPPLQAQQEQAARPVSPAQPIQPIPPMRQTQPVPMPQSIPFMGYSTSETDDTSMGDETELWGGGSQAGTAAYLEYYENGRLNRIPINPLNGTVIGRLKEQVDFAVKSPRVGKIHARFFSENGQYFVVDINSKNGTYINGNRARIESNIPYPLHDKDRIMLADSEFTIRCGEG